MISKTYGIKGMHCASCASVIELTLKKVPGVVSIESNYGTETIKVSFDEKKISAEDLSKKIEPLGYSIIIPSKENVYMASPAFAKAMAGDAKKEKLEEIAKQRNLVLSALPLAVISIFIMGWDLLAQFKVAPMPSYAVSEFFHHLLPIMATYMLFVVGKPYLLGFYRFLRYGKANMDSLIGIGTSVAFLYSFILTAFEEPLGRFINVSHTYYDVTIVVITFIALGKYLEVRSKLKTGDAIEKLLNLQAKTALVIRDGKETEISINEVVHGDLIIVKPGAKIPVDGVITEGTSFIDEALVIGEPMPKEKNVGDTVISGTLNTNSTFTFKATKVGSETLLARIVTMVQEAQGSKAPIQALADKISSVFVPIVLVIAFVSLAVWLTVGTYFLGFSQALSYGLTSFVGVLVIACPCALGLATPTAIIVGVGKGAREGILIKDAATLEKLHKVTTVVMDKTGTITRGKPEFAGIKNYSLLRQGSGGQAKLGDAEVISILAGLEKKSEHPIAHAILEYAKEKSIEAADVEKFESVKGKGLKGIVGAIEYFAGNIKLISDLKIKFDAKSIEAETLQGKTPVILATAKEVVAVVMVADTVKPEAVEAIQNLHKLGIKTVMLTGDNANTASAIAKQVGIDQVFAQILPEDKLNKIKELQAGGNLVAMAGDGVNDAPALAQADVGIAMATGTDVAIETAGITLLYGDISKIVKAIRLSRITMRGIKQNLFWAFIYNLVGIPLAAGLFFPLFGWLLNPIFAGLAMAFSSVSVVFNSLRIKVKRI
ncbi:heavy metal translocating P-type ATPase [Candidatus Parcubacteria bacterium]|nr:heavy metal translocating P-type ATPase [Candidatus Parcubacteria bacterium]